MSRAAGDLKRLQQMQQRSEEAQQQPPQPQQPARKHPHMFGWLLAQTFIIIALAASVARIIMGFQVQSAEDIGSVEDCKLTRRDNAFGKAIPNTVIIIAALVAIMRRSIGLFLAFLVLAFAMDAGQAIYTGYGLGLKMECEMLNAEDLAAHKDKALKRRDALGFKRIGETVVTALVLVILWVLGNRVRAEG